VVHIIGTIVMVGGTVGNVTLAVTVFVALSRKFDSIIAAPARDVEVFRANNIEEFAEAPGQPSVKPELTPTTGTLIQKVVKPITKAFIATSNDPALNAEIRLLFSDAA
jgi:hypothetical protein